MNNPSYCTSSDLKDIYPSIDEFDMKTPIYGWSLFNQGNDSYVSHNCGVVNNLYKDGADNSNLEVSSANAVDGDGAWYYDENNDSVYFSTGGEYDPNDVLMESGEDWKLHMSDIIQKASAYFDSRVDANLPREQFKDEEGEYDYLVVRTTSLIACNFLIKAQNPTSSTIETFEEEINFNLDLINSGKAKLSHQVSGDSSKGYVKEIALAGNVRIVDTRGSYSGTYDRIKVKCTTGGIISAGLGKYSVWVKGSDYLKQTLVIDDKVITGDYQPCAGGLQIRFQGTGLNNITINDEWEIEVFGSQESLDDNIGAVKYTSMTRTNRPFRKGYGYIG